MIMNKGGYIGDLVKKILSCSYEPTKEEWKDVREFLYDYRMFLHKIRYTLIYIQTIDLIIERADNALK